MKLVKVAGCLVALVALAVLVISYIHLQYLPVRQGKLYLQRANSASVLLREAPHGIHHIHADSLEMAIYTQGFAHAQDRLWQMEKQRMLTSGRLSEVFGERALDMDKFSISIGYRRMAEETWKSDGLTEEDKKLLQAYADGVNDFLDGVGYFKEDNTAFFLPPEFVALGIKEVEKWHPTHTLQIMAMMNFHMTENWSMDLLRHIIGNLEDGSLRDMVEEVLPFEAKYHYNLTTILNEKEMEELGLLHPERKTIEARYEEAKKANKIPDVRHEAVTEQESAKRIKQKASSNKDEVLDNHSNLGGQFASNNWVISGKHTQNGMPMLATDPHLGTGIPSVWTLQNLHIKMEVDGKNRTEYMSGASMPGIPLIIMGRTRHITWGMTSAITDTSDLFKEKIEGDKYFVDGEWKPLKKEVHHLKIKGQDNAVDFELFHTHRGPVIPSGLMKNAQVLFGAQMPIHEQFGEFSLAWTGHYPGESIMDFFHSIRDSSNLHELKEKTKKIKKWQGISQNIVMADSSGNIGYMLITSIPERKNEVTYVGARVLDGTTSEYDWTGLGDFSKLPFQINPEKGYYVTANNRQVPDTALHEIGVTHGSTIRSMRINELIEQGVKEGKKFTVQDMVDIQQDVVDASAREMTPHILKIAEQVLGNDEFSFTENEKKDARFMMELLKDFKGEMEMESVPATVFEYWHYYFFQSFLKAYTTHGEIGKTWMKDDEPFWTTKQRLSLVDNYPFIDFYSRLILHLSGNEKSVKYDKLCQKGFGENLYNGAYNCQYNIARAFIEAKKHLKEHVSTNSKDWQWKNVHVNEYPSHPWSLTKLKPIWHREVATGGNSQTPCVSKYMLGRIEDNKIIKSTHTANYKQIVSFGKDQSGKNDLNLYSMDTGQAGNLFAGNYFDMNKQHLNGQLKKMQTNFAQLIQDDDNKVLKIYPLKSKKKRVIRPIEEQLVDEKYAQDKPSNDLSQYTDEDGQQLQNVNKQDPHGVSDYYKKKDEEVLKRQKQQQEQKQEQEKVQEQEEKEHGQANEQVQEKEEEQAKDQKQDQIEEPVQEPTARRSRSRRQTSEQEQAEKADL